ncbi:hypothetical protein ACCUM_2522 [Candidatus Accumulibacter phosphatis]|uniref:Uncharacterized protein n=1 Tax=Candidatus Accumulibacter phosphatis TaxID=327160 RepID=A0A5S4ER80_9PROT|nr:hypothetical protein ACCUM_2522 [Candidatus Accumulibacter phosphatis]
MVKKETVMAFMTRGVLPSHDRWRLLIFHSRSMFCTIS